MGMSAQQMLQNDPEYLARQLAQQEIQRYQNFQNPQLGLAATSGAVIGRGLANLFGGRGFFEVSDPALRRVADTQRVFNEAMTNFDPADPAASYEAMARRFSELGFGQQAMMASQEAAKYRKEAERLGIERQRLGFEEKRVGLEQQRIGLETTRIREAQYKENPDLMLMEARDLPEDDPRKQALVNRYYDFKRDQQNRLAREAAELERINAQTAEARARAAREGELGVTGKPGSVGRAGAYRDINGQIFGPGEIKNIRSEYEALDKMLYKINQITDEDVRKAESWFDLTGGGIVPKEAAGKIAGKVVAAQTKIAASQLLEQINSLPPGAASDADMKAAKSAFPGYGDEEALRRWVNDTKTTIERYHSGIAERFGFQRKTTASPLLTGKKSKKEGTAETDEWKVLNVQSPQ